VERAAAVAAAVGPAKRKKRAVAPAHAHPEKKDDATCAAERGGKQTKRLCVCACPGLHRRRAVLQTALAIANGEAAQHLELGLINDVAALPAASQRKRSTDLGGDLHGVEG